ncbi:TetR/AcrR family transcriptional regulator [Dactylosporangium cerinum]|uniref:TetR/AcrR family transcriptional regulator n=1 Tax=Dactylosporangium cerinum TaxID=1434730 RepID=A0ABV9W456_9ACTN
MPNHEARTRTSGRRRSEDAHQEVLQGVLEMLEEQGYGAITIEGVAARTGVAKSTIYRWWSSKGDLVMEAYGRAIRQRMPVPDRGSVEADLTAFVADLYRIARHPARMSALRGLMAEAQVDATFAESFRAWVGERQQVVTDLLQRGVDRGELPTDADLRHAVDLVFGPFWYRLLVGHAPLRAADAPGHVRTVLAGLRQRPPGPAPATVRGGAAR